MKYILRKFIDADSVQDAVRKDRKTPVHDCYLKDGEAPSDGGGGFSNRIFSACRAGRIARNAEAPVNA
jgi:hypothetical protein